MNTRIIPITDYEYIGTKSYDISGLPISGTIHIYVARGSSNSVSELISLHIGSLLNNSSSVVTNKSIVNKLYAIELRIEINKSTKYVTVSSDAPIGCKVWCSF